MLRSSSIVATLSGETFEVSTTTGMLSCLLWNLVMEKLLGELNEGYYAIGYAYDIAILTNGKFSWTVSEVLQTALGLVQQRCERPGLSINPSKMVIVPFTKR
jgi:hypothetical protein